MSKVSVFNQGWIDLVFEGRNKNYGAYKLRQEDSKTTLIALFSGIALIGILVGIPAVANYLKPNDIVVITDPVLPPVTDDIIIKPIELPAKPVTNEAAAPAPKPKEPKTELTPLVATSEPIEKDPPVQDDFKNTNPGDETTKGTGKGIDTSNTSSKGTEEGTGKGKIPDTTGDGPLMMAFVDELPQFPGGNKNFAKKVVEKFNTPSIERVNTITVYVSFVVEKDGTMSNITVPRDPGYGLGEEAIRVLKSIKTKWKPGKRKGELVRTAYSLPIVINVN
jgi:protein TonB